MIEDRVRTFIVKDLGAYGYGTELTDDYPLLQNGLIDSVGIAELVEFIENEFGVLLDVDELVAENFDTVGSIAAMIRSKAPESDPVGSS
jgi:acyl carrier protein